MVAGSISLSISGKTESGQFEEANFPVSISKSLYEQTPLIALSPGSPCPFRFVILCAIFIMFKHQRAALVTWTLMIHSMSTVSTYASLKEQEKKPGLALVLSFLECSTDGSITGQDSLLTF